MNQRSECIDERGVGGSGLCEPQVKQAEWCLWRLVFIDYRHMHNWYSQTREYWRKAPPTRRIPRRESTPSVGRNAIDRQVLTIVVRNKMYKYLYIHIAHLKCKKSHNLRRLEINLLCMNSSFLCNKLDFFINTETQVGSSVTMLLCTRHARPLACSWQFQFLYSLGDVTTWRTQIFEGGHFPFHSVILAVTQTLWY